MIILQLRPARAPSVWQLQPAMATGTLAHAALILTLPSVFATLDVHPLDEYSRGRSFAHQRSCSTPQRVDLGHTAVLHEGSSTNRRGA